MAGIGGSAAVATTAGRQAASNKRTGNGQFMTSDHADILRRCPIQSDTANRINHPVAELGLDDRRIILPRFTFAIEVDRSELLA